MQVQFSLLRGGFFSSSPCVRANGEQGAPSSFSYALTRTPSLNDIPSGSSFLYSDRLHILMMTGFGTSLKSRCLLQPDVLPKFQATHRLNGFPEVHSRKSCLPSCFGRSSVQYSSVGRGKRSTSFIKELILKGS